MAKIETNKTKRFIPAIGGGVVAVEIGAERVRHFIHKALLEEHSEYFRKALNGSWKEAEDKVVCLDDVDCRTFQVFMDWLYTRKLPAKDEDWNQEEYQEDRDDQWRAQWITTAQLTILKAYAFADRMIAPDLWQVLERNLIDTFVMRGIMPTYGGIIYAFDHLPSSSPVLGAMIDAHCREFDHEVDTEKNGELQLRAQLPNAFLIGVMERFAKMKAEKMVKLDKCRSCWGSKSDPKLHRCKYHGYATDKAKNKCQVAIPEIAWSDTDSD